MRLVRGFFLLSAIGLAPWLAGCNGWPLTHSAQSIVAHQAAWTHRLLWVQGKVLAVYQLPDNMVWYVTLADKTGHIILQFWPNDHPPAVGETIRALGRLLPRRTEEARTTLGVELVEILPPHPSALF